MGIDNLGGGLAVGGLGQGRVMRGKRQDNYN